MTKGTEDYKGFKLFELTWKAFAIFSVIVLSAADRMELMPFSQISSRIGGSIILIIGSLLLSILGGML